MVRTIFPGLVLAALLASTLPAAAQTPDGYTPAVETTCDDLANATPGLQGLCVALCEAQDCDATYNTRTDTVGFKSSCNGSAPRLFNNYMKLKTPSDPLPSCVQAACPCWGEPDVTGISKRNHFCSATRDNASLFGEYGAEQASAEIRRGVRQCGILTPNLNWSESNISPEEHATCYKSVVDECTARELLP